MPQLPPPPADAPKTHRLYHLPVGHRHGLPIQRLLQGRTAYTKAGFTPGATPQGLRPGYMPGWSSVCLPAGCCMSLLCPCFAPAPPCSSPLCRPALHPCSAMLFTPALLHYCTPKRSPQRFDMPRQILALVALAVQGCLHLVYCEIWLPSLSSPPCLCHYHCSAAAAALCCRCLNRLILLLLAWVPTSFSFSHSRMEV